MGLAGIFIKNKTLSERTLGRRCTTQGFRQFCKVADIYLKAPDGKFFGAARRLTSAEDASYLGESGACSSRKFLKYRTLRNAVSRVSGTQESISQSRLEFT